MKGVKRTLLWALVCILGGMPGIGLQAAEKDDEEEETGLARPSMRMKMGSAVALDDLLGGSAMGVTPGGAQDIGWFRQKVEAGQVPHPNTITPEGLFSEHDLPLKAGEKCNQTICVTQETTQAHILVQNDVKYLSQLGFSSNINEKTFKRAPLNLVAVVDTSGSMSGDPIRMVRDSLLQVTSQLRRGDQVTIVRYSDVVEVILPATKEHQRERIRGGIDRLNIAGSTYMEAGLKLGFAEAMKSARSFSGTTRVLLFTDERPNVGRTDAQSFMGLARAASKKGVGMTTIGVGVHFGAELATKVSSVRGGNLFFFPTAKKMQQVFEDEFDTLVTELAYNMKLTIQPSKGFKIAGVYGIPGELLHWGEKGEIHLTAETLFLSRKKGAIYVAFASDTPIGLSLRSATQNSLIGKVGVTYQTVNRTKHASNVRFTVNGGSQGSIGLKRGILLVNQITSLKEAGAFHHEKNDQEKAYQVVKGLATLYRQNGDAELATERSLILKLEQILAKMSGHKGETNPSANLHPVTGLPI